VNPLISALPTLLVTAIYYFWHVYHKEMLQRASVLRARVTYMLWVAAQQIEEPAHGAMAEPRA
jgi:hypothetical protein